jgi:hypothetical protein
VTIGPMHSAEYDDYYLRFIQDDEGISTFYPDSSSPSPSTSVTSGSSQPSILNDEGSNGFLTVY